MRCSSGQHSSTVPKDRIISQASKYPFGFQVVASVLDTLPPSSWLLSLLPLIIVAAVILGLILFILLGTFVSRRAAMTMKAGGAVALTLASIFLLSGLWCMLLSPIVTYSQPRSSFYNPVSIGAYKNWSYGFNVQKGDTLSGYISVYDGLNASAKTFSFLIYDPDNILVWSETDLPFKNFNIEALKSGIYKVEVHNPHPQPIQCYVQITVSEEVTYRPLEPFGQWLSLVSLPIFGLGLWASGIFSVFRKA